MEVQAVPQPYDMYDRDPPVVEVGPALFAGERAGRRIVCELAEHGHMANVLRHALQACVQRVFQSSCVFVGGRARVASGFVSGGMA